MAHPPSRNVASSFTLSQLQTTLTALNTASSILQGFAHRNKNQHRGTRWWGPFNMLSRNIRKLLPDLEGAVRRAEVVSSSSRASSAKRRKTDQDGQGGVRQPELDRFAERAQWVHHVISAKAYEAFTQLTADKQFAQLGLVLIGVLAQVEHAIAPFVQTAVKASVVSVTSPVEAARRPEAAPPKVAPSIKELNTGDYDLGVAISREELDNDEEIQSSVEQLTSQRQGKTPLLEDSERVGTTSRDNREGKKLKTGMDVPNIGKDKNTLSLESKDVAKNKKKKKRKGGDEFDDLFSSLL